MIRNELVNPSKNDNFSPVCMRLYLTKIIKENQITFVDLEEIGTSEDTLFNLQYIIHINKAVYYNTEFYHYIRNNYNSVTRSKGMELFYKYKNLNKRLMQEVKKNGLNNQEFLLAKENSKAISEFTLGLKIEKSKDNLKEKLRNLDIILKDEEIRNALKEINTNYMAVHWKVFFKLCKNKRKILVLSLLKIMNIIILKK